MTTPVALLPPAVTALRDVTRGALPEVAPDREDGVEVFDGPDASRPFALRAVTIAAAFEDDQDAIATERVYSGLGRHYTETLSVACSIYVGGGDVEAGADGVGGVETYRAEAGEILAVIADALDADPTLGDTVARARLTSATWLQGVNEQGAAVIVGFVVELVVLS